MPTLPVFTTAPAHRLRWRLACVMAVVVAPLVAWGQTPAHSAAPPTPEQQQVADADDAYIAVEAKHDEVGMRRMIDDRFVFNDEDGTTTGKDAFVRFVLKLPIVGEAVRERSVLVEGNVALVFATTDIRMAPAGKPESVLSLRYTCTYVKRDGQWRMLALQTQKRAAN